MANLRFKKKSERKKIFWNKSEKGESYIFAVRLSPSDMNDLSLRDLQAIYLPPYVSIMLRDALL